MLQLVLGGAGSGKTTHLYAEMSARALRGEKSILIVPEQFTSSTEARIYHHLGDAHSGMVESYSFTSLAEKILTSCGGAAVKTLSDAGRAVLVRRAMHALDGNVQYYHKQRRNAAFCQMVAETIDELKSAGLSAEDFRTLSRQCGSAREKLEELALIFASYEALLAQTGLDPSDRVNLAAAQLAKACSGGEVPAFLEGRAVFIDEFDTFNMPKQRLLAALFASVSGVTVALCADGLSQAAPQDIDGEKPSFLEDVSLFSGARRIAHDLRRLARSAGVSVKTPVLLRADLRHLDAPKLAKINAVLCGDVPCEEEETVETAAPVENAAVFSENTVPNENTAPRGNTAPCENEMSCKAASPAENAALPEFSLFAAQSRDEEARACAAAIQSLVRSGVPYGKIAVVCRTLDDYRTAVRHEFRLANIPLFCDETTTPTFSAPVTAVQALLSIVRGVDYTDQMIALAKTGLCALPEKQVLALENYVYTWSPKRAAWAEPFTRNPRGFGEASHSAPQDDTKTPDAELARAFLLPHIEMLCARTKGADATVLTKQIYHCLQALGAPEQQQMQIAAVRATKGIPAAEAAARAWNVVMELLDQMVHLLGDEVVTPTEYAELFQLLLHASDLGHIPQSLDTVIFTSAGKMRLDNPDYVFVLGLAEGEFPSAPSESGLLTHADRDALMAQNVELPQCFENRIVRENICFYQALTAPKKGLWISWAQGMGMPISSALAPVLATVPPVQLQGIDWQNPTTPAAAIDRLGGMWGEDGVPAASLYAALRESDAAPRGVLDAFAQVAAGAPKQLANPANMEKLLGKTVEISPSKVEKYHLCQYAYFMQYVLGLRARQKAELSPNQSGSLMHWVLQMALSPQEYTAQKPAPFVALSAEQLCALSDFLVEEYQRLYMPEDSQRFAYLLARIKKSTAALLAYVQQEQQQSAFETVLCEAKIGTAPEELPPWEQYVRGDTKVRLIGTIDRVDKWVQDDGTQWLRVVDYKTGEKTFNLKEVYCGLDCQMLLYLFSLVRDETGAFTGVKPAGVLYLLADPAPKSEVRSAAQVALRPALEGMVASEEGLLQAMDSTGEGQYLPFEIKGGKLSSTTQKNKIADEAKMKRISDHLDGLVVEMVRSLYDGKIEASPLCASGRTPCAWCEFRMVCAHEDGVNERALDAPSDPFGEPKDEEPQETKKEG